MAAHLIVANIDTGGLAACGVVIPYPEPGSGPRLATEEPPDRCQGCVDAQAETARRREERAAAGRIAP